MIDHEVCDRSRIVNFTSLLFCDTWGGSTSSWDHFGESTMCGDTSWVIIPEPYEATCMTLPSWVLRSGLNLSLQGLTVRAPPQPLLQP